MAKQARTSYGFACWSCGKSVASQVGRAGKAWTAHGEWFCSRQCAEEHEARVAKWQQERHATAFALPLRIHPGWNKPVLDTARVGVFYTLDGSAYSRPASADEWAVVPGLSFTCLFDWQQHERQAQA